MAIKKKKKQKTTGKRLDELEKKIIKLEELINEVYNEVMK